MRRAPARSKTIAIAVAMLIGVGLAVGAACQPAAAQSWWRAPLGSGAAVLIGGPGTPDDAFAAAIAQVKALPPERRGRTLAVHATAEGHWKLANAAGEVMTARPEEVARVVAALTSREDATATPGAPPVGPLQLVLTMAAATQGTGALAQLPAAAETNVLVGGATRPLRRQADAGAKPLIELRPNLLIEVGEADALAEALWQLDRPLDRGGVRLLSLEPGAARTLPAKPKLDAATRAPLPDSVDPYGLAKALPALAGQKVLIVGRTDGELLWFQPRSGNEQSILLKDLRAAATANDIALVVLDARLVRQPGERTWTLLKVGVPGLDAAIRGGSVADFYDALAKAQGKLTDGKLIVRVAEVGEGRTRLEAAPPGRRETGDGTRGVTDIFKDLVTGTTGQVSVRAVTIDLPSRARQTEVARRLLPGIPSGLQIGYALLLAIGLSAVPVAWRWWGRIWPEESAAEYGGRAGWQAARAARLIVFALVFVPLVALAAFPWQVVRLLAGTLRGVTQPFRRRAAKA